MQIFVRKVYHLIENAESTVAYSQLSVIVYQSARMQASGHTDTQFRLTAPIYRRC